MERLELSGSGDFTYLKIRMRNGQYAHGGNQNWWSVHQTMQGDSAGIGGALRRAREDEAFRIAHMGCGAVAMNDLELYLLTQGAAKGRGELSQEDYEKHFEANWGGRYRIGKDPVNLMVGLYPWKMETGLSQWLMGHGAQRRNVKWAPYWKMPLRRQREMVLTAIREMLAADYPVVCSYHTFDPKKKLVLYHTPDDAALCKGREREPCIGSHYMTVVGIWTNEEGESLLQLESWGRIYYVRYEDYARKLNYFTNILYISERTGTEGDERWQR